MEWLKSIRSNRSVQLGHLPRHVAIIMDGNGRWASGRGLPRVAGHKAGVNSMKRAVELAREVGIQVLTVYAFSTENWQRPAEEVTALLELVSEAIRTEVDELHKNGVKVNIIGRREGLTDKTLADLNRAEEITRNNHNLVLNIAFNYGARAELIDAFRSLSQKVLEGSLSPAEITEEDISAQLYTAEYPDPDLIIRTGGDFRLSNFLLWQAAYSEIYVTNTYWPAFGRREFVKALEDYARRDRRFGKV